jgi:hypothetical protein
MYTLYHHHQYQLFHTTFLYSPRRPSPHPPPRITIYYPNCLDCPNHRRTDNVYYIDHRYTTILHPPPPLTHYEHPLSSGIQDISRRRSSNRRNAIAAHTSIRRIRLTTRRRSVRAPAASLPWLGGCSWGLSTNKLCLDQYRDDGTRRQAEGLMAEDTEERAAFAGVRGDADDGGGVGGEELVEDDLGAVVLGGGGFGGNAVPDLVVSGWC